ncbi:MAG: hypothetical protein JNK76_24445 [Planctomycetales bacterium]|nr:hypothetical protein [Planctomycetales bacterium]MBN8626662.1 hypothetical protein [Planctomycetota bacterium]
MLFLLRTPTLVRGVVGRGEYRLWEPMLTLLRTHAMGRANDYGNLDCRRLQAANRGMQRGDCASLVDAMLTIREVAEKTGHSPHKIRRLIKAIADEPTHPDRSQIEPSVDDVASLTSAGVQFTWRVTEELVRRELGDAVPSSGDDKSGAPAAGESPEWLSLMQRVTDAKEKAEERLFEQIRVKDEQLKAKDEQIAALNDRLRESNFLMQNLQRQLPEPNKPVGPVDKTAGAKNRGEKKAGRPMRPRSPGWFRRLLKTK